jgi:L-aminopeptidase/D-esterase-like protein
MRGAIIMAIGAVCGAICAAGGARAEPLPAIDVPVDGPSLTFDFPAVQIGVAEYEEGPTGATVLRFAKPVLAAVDVRGGAPGTVNTDALRLGYDDPFVSAITLAGGSAYGLSVATGVADALKERAEDPGDWRNIAVVPGAIIFDLGGRRYNAVTPDERLGRAALAAVRSGWVPLGARGAGRFAMQGGYFGVPEHSGQGAAFRESGDVKVLVVTVVNALGGIVGRDGRVLRCGHTGAGECDLISDRIAAHLAGLRAPKTARVAIEPKAGLTANNQVLAPSALQRLAVQVHNSMARAIQPFGTEYDGDTLFAVTTAEVKDSAMSSPDLGALASEAAWDAILASAPVLSAPVTPATITLSSAQLDACVGRYELAPGAIAQIRRSENGIEIAVAGRSSLYLPADRWISLMPVGTDEFALATARADGLHLDRDARGRLVGLTINPGPWPIHARRLQAR